MQGKEQFQNSLFSTSPRAAAAVLALAIVLALTVILITPLAQAQTFKVIHTFTGGWDGGGPLDFGLTMDGAGNLYGTTTQGGSGQCEGGCGTVFKLTPKNSSWLLTTIYGFAGGNDGSVPWSGVIFGPDGNLYGTTHYGGGSNAGAVFNLKPPAACETALCPWRETVLYRFSGGNDGANPGSGEVVFDRTGNLYSVTLWGGVYGEGTVFALAPSQGGWTESVLHSFNENDGALPNSALIFDNVGNLYGTTLLGGDGGGGTVFQLMPSGSAWTLNDLHGFTGGNDGDHAYPGPIFDSSGNIYGGTAAGGQGNGGTVYKLTPSGGGWTYTLVYSLTGPGGDCGPVGNLIMDGAGNLYGTTNWDGPYNAGTVFKLTPSGGNWTYTLLHNFTGGSDGESPGGLIFGKSGNLYGTTVWGGAAGCNEGCGVVFEITFP
jgi:uncharacterized repeat protein (TIGR03803 family)